MSAIEARSGAGFGGRLLAELQHLPRDLEVLAFEAGCQNYCAREIDELELQGSRVYLHLGARRDEPPRPPMWCDS